MKNVYEVLRQKELEISQLKKEVEALRVAVPLLSEDNDGGDENKPRLTSSTVPQPKRGPQPAAAVLAGQTIHTAASHSSKGSLG